ncbi:acyltransferase [Pedobacter sp. HMF7647]|uniref:Acyltransferase n=1 Tax=Hufsiella arboris TaxID=2695275 RepID=A0A7K1YAU9_9SPHI|nr:DapH/DapD/GlmU-related protein [Hufsiella arboris]MXV51706.1 acyltransferase [Hufsiella arboris]
MTISFIKEIIRNTIFRVSYVLGIVCSRIFTFEINWYRQEILIRIYSGWYSTQIGSHGRNIRICYPITSSGLKHVSIGDNFVSGPRLRIDAIEQFLDNDFTPVIQIGNDVTINADCHIGCINEIKIGDGTLIASKVLIIDHFHGNLDFSDLDRRPMSRTLKSKGKILIGNNVWIGEGCIILPGVFIGDNCIIGANSVVTKSFKADLIIGGNPAKIIRQI